MNIANAKTPTDLASIVHAACYCAEVREIDLLHNISRMTCALAAVESPASMALVALSNVALASAIADTTPRARLVKLAELSAWLGMVKVGWL